MTTLTCQYQFLPSPILGTVAAKSAADGLDTSLVGAMTRASSLLGSMTIRTVPATTVVVSGQTRVQKQLSVDLGPSFLARHPSPASQIRALRNVVAGVLGRANLPVVAETVF